MYNKILHVELSSKHKTYTSVLRLVLYNILLINWYTGNITTKHHSRSMGDNTYSCLVLHQKISSVPVNIASDTGCF